MYRAHVSVFLALGYWLLWPALRRFPLQLFHLVVSQGSGQNSHSDWRAEPLVGWFPYFLDFPLLRQSLCLSFGHSGKNFFFLFFLLFFLRFQVFYSVTHSYPCICASLAAIPGTNYELKIFLLNCIVREHT